MQDGIIKGTGNSRYLKSALRPGMPWEEALEMLLVGTFPVDFNGINRDGWERLGTPLDTPNTLSDTTGGLIDAETPDAAFAKIYELAAAAMSSASAGVRVVTGSYAGAGDNSKTLDVGFRPKLVVVTVLGNLSNKKYLRYATSGSFSNYYGTRAAIYAGQSSDFITYDSTNGLSYVRAYTASDTGITMTGTRTTYSGSSGEADGEYVMNEKSTLYYWVAIG